MWKQAPSSHITLLPMPKYGWKANSDYMWETEQRLQARSGFDYVIAMTSWASDRVNLVNPISQTGCAFFTAVHVVTCEQSKIYPVKYAHVVH